MSSPISSSGVSPNGASPLGSSWDLYATETQNDQPSTSRAVCRRHTHQQTSPIAQFAETSLLNWDLSSRELTHIKELVDPKGLADHLAEFGNHLGRNPTEAQEFSDTMRIIQRPIGNTITRNTEEGTVTIEFRPQHGLSDVHGLGFFLERKGGFASCTVGVNRKHPFCGRDLRFSFITVRNYKDLVHQRYKQAWEDREPENSEEYELPDSRYPNSTVWTEKKKTVDQLEKQLSYQDRLIRRAIDMMNGKHKESDPETPFDPAFTRIFTLNAEEIKTHKVNLFTRARLTTIIFEYKTQTVPLDQERACVENILAMPTRTTDEIKKAIENDLREHPIEIVDLHQISHLLEKLGGFASSSACIEREYTIDGQKRHCTAIVLRNHQDLVDERYAYLREKYSTQYDVPDQPPPCDYSVPFLQKPKTPDEAQEQLALQAQLLERAVQKMYVDQEPFDPLFERIYIPTEQELIDNGVSFFNLAQTDTILFVYRTSENRPPKYAVEQMCEGIAAMAEVEGAKVPIAKKNAVDRIREVGLKGLQSLGFFLIKIPQLTRDVSHFFALGVKILWQWFWRGQRFE
ncbi:MAG: hypothetical protein LBC45_01880 [Chlamydiales bacterium]|jgi:hypothetical protein|nr:hypothetical protein [Chlamydiales bacterium]